MGLRCLLGHDFGPSGVVREHEEDGSEMVVTEREIRRCRRCGEEQVLSESTEVRAIRMEDEVRSDRRDADAVAPASSTQGADVGDESPLNAEAAASPASEGIESESASAPDAAALRNAAESVSDPGERGVATTAETAPDVGPAAEDASDDSDTSLIERAEAGFDEPPDDATPEEEDAVILDDDTTTKREYGAWPDDDTVGADDAGAPTGPDSAADGPDADATEADDADDPRSLAERAAEEDAELMGGGSDSDADAERERADASSTAGASGPDSETGWPAHESDDEGFSAGTATSGGPAMAYGNELTPQSTNGHSRRGSENDDAYETSYLDNTVEQREGDGTIVSATDNTTPRPRPGVETEYYCPNCGHTRPLDSSLRTGDICPECQQGYIAEREQ
ncbi:hypothetical protein [Salinigranum sp.]|uniref:DUF7093 family protein n=1 Tax=Salinigranum sp. TaxID=1966351 RepID=UPI0035633222